MFKYWKFRNNTENATDSEQAAEVVYIGAAVAADMLKRSTLQVMGRFWC